MFRKYGLLGLMLIIFAEVCLLLKVSFVSDRFFVFVWYGYIFLVDATVYRLRKNSMIMNQKKRILFLALLSIAGWWMFELFNFGMQNWSYVNGIKSPVERLIFKNLAFATVIPAVFETSDLFKALLFVHKTKKGKNKISKGLGLFYVFLALALLGVFFAIILPSYLAVFLILSAVFFALAIISRFHFFFYVLMGIGLFFIVLSVLRPVQFSYLVWFGFWFLIDPINYFQGEPSILEYIKTLKWKIPISYFIAGNVCGFFWEFWNYWATTKWFYHLPILGPLQSIKLFEMPIFGYIPYGFFAFELFSIYYFTRTLLKIEKKVEKEARKDIKKIIRH